MLISGYVYIYIHKNILCCSSPNNVNICDGALIIKNIGKVNKFHTIYYSSTGISPMYPIQESIEICNLIRSYYVGLLQNGARPSGILTHAAILSHGKREVIQQELKLLYKNLEKGSIAVLEGSYNWTPIGICPEKLNLDTNYNYFSKEIAMSFGVPPIILSITDATFHNYQEAKEYLINNTVLPILRTILNNISIFLELDISIINY